MPLDTTNTSNLNNASASASALREVSVSKSIEVARRGPRGRFISRGVRTERKLKKIDRQREYSSKLRDLKNSIFDKFLVTFVILGSEKDCTPSSRSRGLLQELFTSFVSEVHRLGPNLQYAALRAYVLDGIYVDADLNGVLTLEKYPEEYKYCRIPKTPFASEMKAVRSLYNAQCLVQDSVDQAYDLCLRMLRRFEFGGISQQMIENPQTSNENVAGEPIVCSKCKSGVNSHRLHVNSEENAALQAGAPEGNAVRSFEERQVVDGGNTSHDVENQLRTPLEIFETSKDHDSYVMQHLSLVKGAEWEFGLFASLLLKEWEEQGLTPTDLMREVLTFASWKNNRTVDVNEHAARERCLRETATLMDNTRPVGIVDVGWI